MATTPTGTTHSRAGTAAIKGGTPPIMRGCWEGGRLTPEAGNEEDRGEAAGRLGWWVEQQTGSDHTHHQQPEEGGD